MASFTKKELAIFKRLNTPAKVQDFLNTIPINFELDKINTLKSPLMVMRKWNAHCIEAAILGAYILSLHGHKPLLMDLKTTDEDYEHVIAVYKVDGYWGALSKSNHYSLRFRDPVYKNIRELALSYFNEYFTDDGTKTLRQYSLPLDLSVFADDWVTEEEYGLWGIDDELEYIKHYDIGPKKTMSKLRRTDPIEREAGKMMQYPKPNKKLKTK